MKCVMKKMTRQKTKSGRDKVRRELGLSRKERNKNSSTKIQMMSWNKTRNKTKNKSKSQKELKAALEKWWQARQEREKVANVLHKMKKDTRRKRTKERNQKHQAKSLR